MVPPAAASPHGEGVDSNGQPDGVAGDMQPTDMQPTDALSSPECDGNDGQSSATSGMQMQRQLDTKFEALRMTSEEMTARLNTLTASLERTGERVVDATASIEAPQGEQGVPMSPEEVHRCVQEAGAELQAVAGQLNQLRGTLADLSGGVMQTVQTVTMQLSAFMTADQQQQADAAIEQGETWSSSSKTPDVVKETDVCDTQASGDDVHAPQS